MATNVKLSSVLDTMTAYKNNPLKMIDASYTALKAAYDGDIDIVDASNPFVFLLEQSALTTVAAIEETNAATRASSTILATNMEELYPHLSSDDLIGLVAKPASCYVYIFFDQSEIISKMLPVANTGIKKITIPRDSVFTVAGYDLLLQYPVDIKMMPSGSLSIEYDTTQSSQFKTISSNEVEWSSFRSSDSVQYLRIKIHVEQIKKKTKIVNMTATSGLRTDVAYSTKPYAALVYYRTNSTDEWESLQTTGSTYHFNPDVATANVRFLTTKFRITVPVNYYLNNMVGKQLKICTYETHGALAINLDTYKPNDWDYSWAVTDNEELNTYSAALPGLRTIIIHSDDRLTGGSLPDTFTTIKSKVIARTLGKQTTPVTANELDSYMSDLGFKIVKKVDTVTDRIYYATRSLPDPNIATLSSRPGLSQNLVALTLANATNAYGVNQQNANAVVITPSALFQVVNGIYTPITSSKYATISSYNPTKLCNHLKSNKYTFTPFHYCLDNTSGNFSVRAYYLSQPYVDYKTFVASNEDTEISISTAAGYTLEKTDTAYILTFITSGSDNFIDLEDEDISVSLSIVAPNESTRSYFHATLDSRTTSGQRRYKVTIPTRFFVDATDNLMLNNAILNGQTASISVGLVSTFDLIYCIKGAARPNPSSFDDLIDTKTLGTLYRGLSHEKFQIAFGKALNNLWVQYRSSPTATQYLTYPEDVYSTYPKNIYQVGPDGLEFTLVNGTLVWNTLEHRAGDIVMRNGSPVIKHAAGETVFDAEGLPVVNPAYVPNMVRQISLTMFDAIYNFSTDEATQDYMQSVVQSMVKWITQDLVTANNAVLELTKIYYYPKTELGYVNVITPDSTVITVDAKQKFTVTAYVAKKTIKDEKQTAALTQSIITAIKQGLDSEVISTSKILSMIRATSSEELIDVQITSLVNDKYKFLTMANGNQRLSLGAKLVALPDRRTVVQDDVNIIFTAYD